MIFRRVSWSSMSAGPWAAISRLDRLLLCGRPRTAGLTLANRFQGGDPTNHVDVRHHEIQPALDISGCEGLARRGSILFRCERTYSCELLRRDHWDPSVHRHHDLAPRLGVKPVGELGQPLVQPAPELNAGGHGWRRPDRAQARDVLAENPAVLPAVFNQAHCQPIGRLAKVHEHCSGTIRARFLPSEAGPLLAAPASSWRTTCHSITSSARASSVGGMVRPSALPGARFRTRSHLVGCSTGVADGLAPRRILST